MIARLLNDVLLCDACFNHAIPLGRFGLVGPGTVFDKACPHVEQRFLEWHSALRERESPLFKHIWQPFCIGLLLGASCAALLFPWGSV